MKRLTVEFGYLERSIELTDTEWGAVQTGEPLVRLVEDVYEGETLTYTWHFNSTESGIETLVVTYNDDAVGFIGSIKDGWVEDV